MPKTEMEYLRQQVNEANLAQLPPIEIARRVAADQALAARMGAAADAARQERQRAEAAAARAKAEAEEERREAAEAAHLEAVRDRFLRSGGTQAGWATLKAGVLQQYRESLLGGAKAQIAAKRSGGDYGL